MSGLIKKEKTVADPVVEESRLAGHHPEGFVFDWRTFDPSQLKGGVEDRLAIELVTYRDKLDELLLHQGQYVVIRGTAIVGYHRDRKSAVAAAIREYGDAPVLIKQIVETEPVRRIGHVVL